MFKTLLTATLLVSALSLTSCASYGNKGFCCKKQCSQGEKQCSVDKRQCKMKDKAKCGGGAGSEHKSEEEKAQ